MTEQDEISGFEKIGWEKHSWENLSLIDDERIIYLQRTKVFVFSDSVLCLERIHQNPEANKAWEQRVGWTTSSQSYRDFDGINGEPTEFEWNIFPGFDTLRLCGKVKDLLSRLGEAPEISQEEFYLCRCSTTFPVEQKTMNKNVWHTLESYLCMQGGLVQDQWSFIGPGSEKKLYSIKQDSPQGIWDNIAEKMLVDFAESGCPIFSVLRLHCPEVNSEAKDMEICRFTLLPLRKQLRLSFPKSFLQISSVFTEQSRKCVKNMNPFTIDQGDLIW